MALARAHRQYTRDLAWIQGCEARARAWTARRLASLGQPRPASAKPDTSGWSRRAKRRYAARLREQIARRQADQFWSRDAVCRQPDRGRWEPNLLEQYQRLQQEATRWQREAAVRKAVAAKLYALNAWLPHPIEKWDVLSERLFFARTSGHWGIDRLSNRIRAAWEMHSHCPLLDPAEARERQREVIERALPVLDQLRRAGRKLYTAVLTMPNVPPGRLAWAKRAIYQRFDQIIRGVTANGKKKLPADQRALPEVTGAFVTQEDPLAQDLRSWNVHLNVLLVVDPKSTRRWMDIQPGEAADPAPLGTLSFKRLRRAWSPPGQDWQVEVRELHGKRPELIRACLEVIKYSMKAITKPQLGKALTAAGEPLWAQIPPEAHRPTLELNGATGPRGRARHGIRGEAPPFISWPLERVHEWLEAQFRFRRIRTFGELYRLPERPDPPATDIRWFGRLSIGATFIQADPPIVGSIQPDKSPGKRGGGPPRSPPPAARWDTFRPPHCANPARR